MVFIGYMGNLIIWYQPYNGACLASGQPRQALRCLLLLRSEAGRKKFPGSTRGFEWRAGNGERMLGPVWEMGNTHTYIYIYIIIYTYIYIYILIYIYIPYTEKKQDF